MTAWQIGYRGDESPSLAGGGSGLGAYVGRVIEWIPADVVALYGVVVTSLQATATDEGKNPSAGWLIVFIAITPFVSWLGVLAAKRPFTWRDLAAGGLALVAFAIWSTSVPLSGWGRLQWVRDNPTQLAISAAVGGLLFSLLASVINDWVPNKRIRHGR
jgi:hypothetical protein